MSTSIQFSVTKVGHMYKVIAQDEKEIVRSYFSDDSRIVHDLSFEISELEQLGADL